MLSTRTRKYRISTLVSTFRTKAYKMYTACQSWKTSPGTTSRESHTVLQIRISTCPIWEIGRYWDAARCICKTRRTGSTPRSNPTILASTAWTADGRHQMLMNKVTLQIWHRPHFTLSFNNKCSNKIKIKSRSTWLSKEKKIRWANRHRMRT